MVNRSLRSFLGWFVLVVLALSPVFLWSLFGDYASSFSSYAEITHNLGELFGLVGMTLFALTFLLSTRIRWIEDVFGGLDKVYIVHGILGGSALMLILFHPILLVLKFIPSNPRTAWGYLIPSSYWSVNFGIIALFGMIVLIYLTLYTKIRYQKWKFSHEFLGLVFIFAVLHTFLVRGNASADDIFSGYYVFASVVSFIGLFGFSYSLFLKDRVWKNAVYTISRIDKGKDLFSLFLVPEHKPLSYKSGQFVYLRFYNKRLSREPHPFSIASKSDSSEMKIIIKKLGDFTSGLDSLVVGDKVSLEGPYGRFIFRDYASRDQVWIAAGIGITPFLGGVEELDDAKFHGRVLLFHSVKRESDFVDVGKLNVARGVKYRFVPWVSSRMGYLTLDKMMPLIGDVKGKEFFICGPDGFKEGIIADLKRLGVRSNRIHEEAFGFR